MTTRPVQAAAPIKTLIFLIMSISSKTDFHHRLFDQHCRSRELVMLVLGCASS